jgi:tRNA pseudouridine38/39 synthase
MDSNSGEQTDYSAWSQEKLIERVTQLEAELKAQNRRFFYSPPLPLKTEILI